ncbi:MAG: phospholipid carrier-dependent glycosyltransferase [Cellulomonas sp. 73-92]|uniref:dolichyl-phosphate-mannose--protein mannosyltransferase n=1 Tax=Cellulomonas sp. 73-92 TaxID=1895740 RepID=UPI000925E757|nr:phospholipid carrier-dependent glycosyltransferase [Cellulomonas sp. 73-92]OJV81596.1 MAG: phospholipid carrier-dependent glycosyltransferase [Cellulomonas sp. 73-92]
MPPTGRHRADPAQPDESAPTPRADGPTSEAAPVPALEPDDGASVPADWRTAGQAAPAGAPAGPGPAAGASHADARHVPAADDGVTAALSAPETDTDAETPLPRGWLPEESTLVRLQRRLLGDAFLALDATRRARVLGWVLPLAVTLVGGILRFWHLGTPHALVFDETYYVKDGYSMFARGYEANWGADPNPRFEAGDTSMLQTAPEYVVHPTVGKWLIGLGIQLGGGVTSSFAWRLAAAVFGTLAILLIARIGRRLFASTALGTLAGLFLAVDGEALVQSRISLLDPFLMFFVLAAFGALLLDRYRSRRRLADRAAAILDSGGELETGPALGFRWWRLVATVLLGLACGTKWSGIYFLAVFGVMSVWWDLTARRAVGVRHWVRTGILRDGIPAFAIMVPGTALVYLATWTSWFLHPNAWGRQWAAQNPGQGVQWLPPALRSLWKYHLDMWHFHNTLTSPHPYAAEPLGWIIQWRPTSFWYPTTVSGLTGQSALDACGSTSCSQPVTSLGNPLIWWAGAAALLVALWWLVRHRDWRAGAVLAGVAAGWLPWFAYAHRTIFTFYSVAFVPWVVLTLVYVLGLIVGPARAGEERGRRIAIWGVTGFVVLVVAVGLFFYPVWSAQTIPYQQWHIRMWLPSWI